MFCNFGNVKLIKQTVPGSKNPKLNPTNTTANSTRRQASCRGSRQRISLHPPTSRAVRIKELPQAQFAMITYDCSNQQPRLQAEVAYSENYENIIRFFTTNKKTPETPCGHGVRHVATTDSEYSCSNQQDAAVARAQWGSCSRSHSTLQLKRSGTQRTMGTPLFTTYLKDTFKSETNPKNTEWSTLPAHFEMTTPDCSFQYSSRNNSATSLRDSASEYLLHLSGCVGNKEKGGHSPR